MRDLREAAASATFEEGTRTAAAGIGGGVVADATGQRDRELQWLKERHSMIGASESPILIGEGYKGQSPYALWVAKTTGEVLQDDRDDLAWGKIVQPAILAGFEYKTGFKVRDPGQFTVRRHPELPFIGATLDGLTDTPDGEAVVEAKNVGHYNREEWEDDEPPLRVQVQVQHQLFVTGLKVAYAAASIGGKMPSWRKIYRNDRFIDALLPTLEEFWQRVLRKEPPPIDGSEATTAAIKRLYARETKGKVVMLSEASASADVELLAAKVEIKRLEEVKERCENVIRADLQDAQVGTLPNGAGMYKLGVVAGGHVSYERKEYRRMTRSK